MDYLFSSYSLKKNIWIKYKQKFNITSNVRGSTLNNVVILNLR